MVVFTDLDGTLLDRETYSYAQAGPAMAHLRARGIPLVLVTSKTRAEVAALRAAMGNTDPYIVENGAAIVTPGAPDVVLGATAAASRAALRRAAVSAGVQVRGFGDMALSEICDRSGLTPRVAELAAQREFGEPFVLLAGDPDALEEALHREGFQLTRGGRFFHVLGGSNKARAVRTLATALGESDTIGLGDAPNDIEFLREVRRPVIVPSPHLDVMRAALPGATIAPAPGPAVWNQVILDLVP
jgi:mannosyl-3-phosphoglycerate phosphatase